MILSYQLKIRQLKGGLGLDAASLPLTTVISNFAPTYM